MTHVVDSELIQCLGNFDLLLGIKESVGELFTLTKSTLDDLEAGDIAQKIGHADIVTVGVTRRMRVLAGLNRGEAGVVSLKEKKKSALNL